ncbi:hypothetical protein ES707_07543 [subsurface metagenome]
MSPLSYAEPIYILSKRPDSSVIVALRCAVCRNLFYAHATLYNISMRTGCTPHDVLTCTQYPRDSPVLEAILSGRYRIADAYTYLSMED